MPVASKAINDISDHTRNELVRLGQHIKEAIKCRETLISFAERTQMHRDTLRKVINGEPSTPIGFYLAAIETLGFDTQVSQIAAPEKDAIGQGIRLGRFSKETLPSDF